MGAMVKSVCDRVSLVTCMFAATAACVSEPLASHDSASAGSNDKLAAADLAEVSTDELVRSVAALPGETVVIFDFDDTLLDHVDGRDSEWAKYASRGISYLQKHAVNIAVCSQNQNRNNALNRRLPRLNAEVFNDRFFDTPAFQADTGRDKWDNIQKIMRFYGVTREDHVVFFDDNEGHIKRVGSASEVIAFPVGENGLDRGEFRDGLTQMLVAASSDDNGGPGDGSGCGEGVSGSDYCSVCGNCQVGEGDCDDHDECAPGLICVSAADGGDKDQPGYDVCALPDGGTQACDGQCSPACPCAEGEGDCDTDADCTGDLVCPANGEGPEFCEQPGDTGSCDGRCSATCPCAEGEGDCDRDADCAGELVCPRDTDGPEFCEQPGNDDGDTRCEGQCSADCPCGEGEGDCDRDEDCAGDLVCPPDRKGAEQCERPSSDG